MHVREILDLYLERRNALGPMHQRALELLDIYGGKLYLPLPELDTNEKPLVANLVFVGVEQKSMRVASTMPTIMFPPTRDNATQKQAAVNRKDTILAWWELNKMRRLMKRRARQIVAYASSPVIIRPNFAKGIPTWQVQDPIRTFAADTTLSDIRPADVIFMFTRPGGWVKRNYPAAWNRLNKGPHNDDLAKEYQILDYSSAEEMVLAVVGEKFDPHPATNIYGHTKDGEIVQLERIPNRLGMCPAVVSNKVSLDDPRGEFDGVAGLLVAQAKLMALETIGVMKGIWPEEWLVDNPNDPSGARIITHADPMQGITGRVSGGSLTTIQPLPAVFANTLADRFERGMRIEAGIPAELGGESTSNIRTGRRGDAILSAVLDFPLAEAQELLEMSLEEENKIAIAIDKAYFPTAKSIYLSSTRGEYEYTASSLWSTDTHTVRYAHAGVDARGITVEVGQLLGMGLMSRRTAMSSHPMTSEDVEAELDLITAERLEEGMLTALQAMAQDPMLAPHVAKMIALIRQDKIEVDEAVVQIQELIQQQQAQMAQQAQMGMGGGMGPEAQPGLAAPEPTIPPVGPSQANMTQLLNSLGVAGRAQRAAVR